MALLLKLSHNLPIPRLPQPNPPHPLPLLPPAPNDFSIEGHILPQPKTLTHIIQILPDIRALTEEARPVRIQCKGVRVRVRRDIARSAWIAVLEPGAADVGVLLVDLVRDVAAVLLDLVGEHYTADAGADGEDLEVADGGVLWGRVLVVFRRVCCGL